MNDAVPYSSFSLSELLRRRRPNFSLVNASIGYSPANSHWTVALWGKNLADTQYINGILGSNDVIAPVGDPRTLGVRINYTY